MTAVLEPGSQEWYLARWDADPASLPHDREYYAASGPVPSTAPLIAQAVTVQAPPLGYMLDWSGARLTEAQLQQAKQLGARAASRYLSPDIPATAWKRITSPEASQVLRWLDLWLNFEWYSGRCLEGASAGTEDGRTAWAACQALSYPSGRVIPVSHDTGTENDPAVIAYLKAFNAQLHGDWAATGYGSYHTTTVVVAAAGLIRTAWQTGAWSNGQRDPAAAAYQNGNQWFGGSVDENEIQHWPFGTWNGALMSTNGPENWDGKDFAKLFGQMSTYVFLNPDVTLPDGSVDPAQTAFGAAFGRLRDKVYAVYNNLDAPGPQKNALAAAIASARAAILASGADDATKAQLDAAVGQITNAVKAQPVPPTVAQIVAGVVAALPSDVTGATKQDIIDAVTQVLTGAYLTPKASS